MILQQENCQNKKLKVCSGKPTHTNINKQVAMGSNALNQSDLGLGGVMQG